MMRTWRWNPGSAARSGRVSPVDAVPAVDSVPPVETGGYDGTKSAFADSGENIRAGGEGGVRERWNRTKSSRAPRGLPRAETGSPRRRTSCGCCSEFIRPSRRRFLTAAIATVLLAACGRAEGAQDEVTLRFWAMGAEGEKVQELVREFEREHPGIRVEVQQIPWTAAHEKLLTAYVGDAVPDVSQLGNTWIPEFAALNALEPLDPWMARSSVVSRRGYFPGIWDTNVVDQTVYGVPWYVDTRLLFYRSDLLKAAGYDSVPQTWEGWRDALRALKARMGPRQYPILLPTNEWQPPVILGLQAGSPLLRDGGRHGGFSDPRFRRAFDFYVSLFREDLAPRVSNTEISNLYQEFERGNLAMYITGPWNLGEFASRLPPEMQDKWATAPLPGPDGPGVSVAGGASLVVFRGARHKPEAWKLIEFLSRPDVQARFYEITGDLPARRESWSHPKLADPRASAFRAQLERVVATPKVPEWEQIAADVMEHGERAIRGGQTVEAALRALDADVDGLLEKRRWLLARDSTRRAEAASGGGR
jgi:multiple sugar transport system substrate-binding protein